MGRWGGVVYMFDWGMLLGLEHRVQLFSLEALFMWEDFEQGIQRGHCVVEVEMACLDGMA